MKINARIIFITIISLFTAVAMQAQCPIQNNYFQAGEEMTYDLYAQLGPIHSKAGYSILKTEADKLNGADGYKVTLIAGSTGTISKFFSLNDTLTSHMTKEIVPQVFLKNAHEGNDETHEVITYKYPGNNKVEIHTRRVKNGEERFDETIHTSGCIYDMLSVVMYARTLDYSSMKKGDEATVQFISGKKKVQMIIGHEGFEKMKANDKITYDCIKLVLSISDDAFTDKEEAMRVYITNDKNRMPVRLDSKLKVGSTRAILKSYKGNRFPIGQQ